MTAAQVGDVLIVGYWLIAAAFCVTTWVDNFQTHYVYGPPSGILTGLFWPFILIACLVMWWCNRQAAPSPTAGDE